ncbi:hypothetical protein MUG84_16105 [Paenibacillus sp. KQZ6P-2]|uniref:DNA topology modulation protein FlaR n=1 Tax=Paenibacillus mangrovi TaxID=2931978 RepID=A0A9X1WSS1_9BACL|nr:hypothetical protein [Paenibacillus mangrovi]MCJ8013255.1 hypothetical protein [Paenibacillus mangrovi]
MELKLFFFETMLHRKGEIPIRIRIIGACGSGKSYIARECSRRLGIPHYETDNFVWERGLEQRKFPIETRDRLLREAVRTEAWIIEGVHHKWGKESFEHADVIFIISPNKFIRDFRILRRFVRARLGLERANYKQSFKNLLVMTFVWNKGFDQKNMNEILELTQPYEGRRIIVKSNKEILEYIQGAGYGG